MLDKFYNFLAPINADLNRTFREWCEEVDRIREQSARQESEELEQNSNTQHRTPSLTPSQTHQRSQSSNLGLETPTTYRSPTPGPSRPVQPPRQFARYSGPPRGRGNRRWNRGNPRNPWNQSSRQQTPSNTPTNSRFRSVHIQNEIFDTIEVLEDNDPVFFSAYQSPRSTYSYHSGTREDPIPVPDEEDKEFGWKTIPNPPVNPDNGWN